MKFKNLKTKLVARVMLLVLLFASVYTTVSCYDTEPVKSPQVDINKTFNLDEGEIKFLCMRSIKEIYPLYGIEIQTWRSGYADKGITIVDEEEYSRPYISYYGNIICCDDINSSNSDKYSINIRANFYAFQGEKNNLKYEFDVSCSNGEKIFIYNNDELIGTVSFTTEFDKPDEFYTELLDNTLFVISTEKYASIEASTNILDKNIYNIEPDIDWMYLSYFTIRDIRNTNPNNKLNQYKSNFKGGYGSVYWDFGYDDVINKIELTFFDALLELNVQMRAEFYEYREQMGKIEYAFINTYNNENCVELYSNSELVGKVFYSSDIKITEDWLVDFLNENLVVINVKK